MNRERKRASDVLDELVGLNIRLLRESRGMSQTTMGRHLGVTFQQVQKYESGRVASSQLFKIAALFGVPLRTFFEGVKQPMDDGDGHTPVARLAQPYALRLVTAFCAVADQRTRRAFVELVEMLARRASS